MSVKKRVLIVSYYFGPQNNIGAVRPTKLAKYLQRMGCEVTVICGSGMDDRQDPTLQKDLEELKDVRVIREWNPLKSLKRRKTGAAASKAAVSAPAAPGAAGHASKPQQPSLARRLANSAYLFLWVLSDMSFERRGKRELKRLNGVYDAVFSSYSPMSAHEIGALAKKRGLAKRWVADFRDEMDISFRWQEGKRRKLWRKLAAADGLTAVSEGTLRAMGIESRGSILCNGFDREDAGAFAAPPEDGIFRATYCGQFHMGRKGVGDRDLRPILAALRKLVDAGELSRSQLRLCYAGSEGDVFSGYAESCGLADCVALYGSVSREESLRLQSEANVLLMASWNLSAQTGILTGKVFEYLMTGKPIACYMSGEVGGSGLKALLNETGAGFCAEQAEGEKAREELCGYLLEVIRRWRQGETLAPRRDETRVEVYSYSRLVKELAGLLGLE